MTQKTSALIGSRICHDLISPIGAIGNGLELLGMTLGNNSPEMSLIEDSVNNANARIKFFRIAYGQASAGQQVGRNELLSVLSGLAYGGRFTYVWQPQDDVDRLDVRIAFLILQCFETALPLGGEIEINRSDAGWSLVARGRRVNLEPRLWDLLTANDPDPDVGASEVQFALLPDVMAHAGKSLHYTHADDHISVTF